MSDNEERSGGFLSGWSRRKLEAKRQEAAQEEPPEELLPAEEPAASEEQGMTPEQIAELPSIEEITAGFDIKPFLAKGVPSHLKNAALRRLWSVSPSVSAYSDPAVDYAWDWNAPGGVPGGGGVLSEQSVAKMVKDLIGGPPEPKEAESALPEEPEEPEEPGQLAEGAAEETAEAAAEPQSVRLTTQDKPAVEKKPLDQASSERPTSPAPPRRHGGAAPD